MVVLSHPTGNQNVRQALLALHEGSLLERFHTTVYWDARWKINAILPNGVRTELNRRSYPLIPKSRICSTPIRDALRMLSCKAGLPELDVLSFTNVVDALDRVTAREIGRSKPKAVYAYEGVALQTFRAAKRQGATCIYELPSGYWYYELELLREEAMLQPEYADTIPKLKDTREHLERKDEELRLADHIIVPSQHVVRTLREAPVLPEQLHVIAYGARDSGCPVRPLGSRGADKLRILFVGALTQRKGISYLLDAVEKVSSSVELTLIGSRVGTSPAIERALKTHRWVPSAPHHSVIAEMANSDVLVLPSISEAFGLVITEALAAGLPVITTPNAGGAEVIRDQEDGFIVPIRSVEAIGAKLEILIRDRERLNFMSARARARAQECSWLQYRIGLRSVLQRLSIS